MPNIPTTSSSALTVKNNYKSSKKDFFNLETTVQNEYATDRSVSHAGEFSNTQVSAKLYDRNDIDRLVWPNTDAGQFAKRYLLPLIKNGPNRFIDNINAEMQVLQIDNHVLPILIVDDHYENSYVCSPYGHYVSLALDKLYIFKKPLIRKAAEVTLKILGKMLRKGRINKIVYVNHWLLSTDLHPQNLSKKQVEKITGHLQEKFPDSAIAFRSINAKISPHLKKEIRKCGFKLIVSRQIYLTDTSEKSLFNTRIIKSDLKLWRESGYEVVDGMQLNEEEKQRILQLYNLHSIVHHSSLNPQFNDQFLNMMLDQNLLHIKALKRDGIIEGVVGYQIKNGVFFCPFFGYDKTREDQTRLYRLLSTMLLLEATKEGKLFHQSAGGSFYKKIRRAMSYTEYLGVYTKHLPIKQRMAWGLVRTIMNIIAVPLMKNY